MAYLLLAYLVAFIGTTFVAPTYRVWRRTGTNPYALCNSDSAHDYIGGVLRITLALIALSVAANLAPREWYRMLTPITWLEAPMFQVAGVGLLTASLVWIIVAQAQMGDAWRIGIPAEAQKTPLVTSGLFSISRNPIFLGMAVALLGFFMALPNAVTLLTLVLGVVLMQIQVRLEEDYLQNLHGAAYADYRRHVQRWL